MNWELVAIVWFVGACIGALIVGLWYEGEIADAVWIILWPFAVFVIAGAVMRAVWNKVFE